MRQAQDTAREWGTTLSHFLGGPPGWTDMDRLLALARAEHDAQICPSGAGPMHYRDECDEDSENFTDPQPEPVESTCAWLVASQEYDEEAGKAEVREKGLLVGWRDGSARSLDSHSNESDHSDSEAHAAEDRE